MMNLPYLHAPSPLSFWICEWFAKNLSVYNVLTMCWFCHFLDVNAVTCSPGHPGHDPFWLLPISTDVYIHFPRLLYDYALIFGVVILCM